MLDLCAVHQNDLINECNKRVLAMRLRVISALEKKNLEEMGLKDLATYTALLTSVGTLLPFGFGAAACCCESKEE